MQQHHSSDFAAGIADRHAYRDHQLAQYGIDLLHDKVLSGKALFHRSFDFRRQSVIVKITGRFGYILLLTHQHPLMSVHHPVLFGQRAGVLTVHFDIFILIDHPHVFHRDIVDITDETAAADTAVTVLQPRHIILQYLGNLRCPHLHLFLFQIQRMLAEKMHKGAAHDQSKNQQYRCKIQRQLPGDFIAHALSPRNGSLRPKWS